jgi:hypothetical protein
MDVAILRSALAPFSQRRVERKPMEDGISILIGIALWTVGIILAAAWMLLPLLVINKLNKLVQQNDRALQLLNVIANHTAPGKQGEQ